MTDLTAPIPRVSVRESRPRRQWRKPWHPPTLAFTLALVGGAALRFWQLASKPDWQYDEGVYTEVARNVQHGVLAEHITVGAPWSPFLYQPPVYFLILARWFALTGASIYHARILGVLCSLATLAVLYRLLCRLRGPVVALYASIPVVYDGWLLYIQRVSYIENLLLLLVAVSMLAYQRALDVPSKARFATAGAMIGATVAVKYTAAYLVGAVLLCWLISTGGGLPRQHRRLHAGHLVLLTSAAAVLGVYALMMWRLFDLPHHDWWIQQNTLQLRRVLGLQKSGGTLTSPTAAAHLLFAQYRVFAPSFAIAVASFAIAVRRLLGCWRARSWAGLQGNALLFSWLAAGVIVFGSSSLRFPQYFALILVPMYCFWWTEVWQWEWRPRPKLALAAVAAVLGVLSFTVRVPAQPATANPFRQAATYAAASIPRGDTVITEEAIGDLIAQPYCRVEQPGNCASSATYAITWKTYLQSSFTLGGQPFARIMHGAVPLKSWTGFSGTATVWRLR